MLFRQKDFEFCEFLYKPEFKSTFKDKFLYKIKSSAIRQKGLD